MRKMKVFFIFIVFVAYCTTHNKSSAATLTSNGTGGGDWDAAVSWDSANTPDDMSDGDTLVIQLGDIITITGNRVFQWCNSNLWCIFLDKGRLNMPILLL